MSQPVQPARRLEKHVPIDQARPCGCHNSPSSDDIPPSSLESSALGDHFGTPKFPPKDHPHVLHRSSMLRDHSGEIRKYRKPAAYGQYCISRHRTRLKTTNSKVRFPPQTPSFRSATISGKKDTIGYFLLSDSQFISGFRKPKVWPE